MNCKLIIAFVWVMANENCDVCNQCCATVHYKNVNALKVGGTKHRASPPLQKVGGTCPPVHPRIYAHAHKVRHVQGEYR